MKHKQMLFADFPKLKEVTNEVKRKNYGRFFVGGVRIKNGMYRTDAETAKYITDSLKRQLP